MRRGVEALAVAIEVGRHSLEGARPVENRGTEPEGMRARSCHQDVAFVPVPIQPCPGRRPFRHLQSSPAPGKAPPPSHGAEAEPAPEAACQFTRVLRARGNGQHQLHPLSFLGRRGVTAAIGAIPQVQSKEGMFMTSKPLAPSPARDKVRGVVPKLIDLTEKVLFGDVWERPGLSKRDRSLITCAALVALNRTEQLKGHLERALNNGVTPDEIGELITHLAFYGGWPVAMSGALVAKDVLEQHKK